MKIYFVREKKSFVEANVRVPTSMNVFAVILVSFLAFVGLGASNPRVSEARDLVIENLALSSGNVSAGGSTTVSYNVANRGTTTVTPTYTDRIYLSINNTLEPSDDVLLGTSHGHTADLAVNAVHPHSQTVTVPSATTAGNYFILVQADALSAVAENNETNNVTAVPLTVSVQARDLVIENLALSSGNVSAGGSTTVSYNVANRGTTTVTPTYTDRIYLSSNNTLEPGDVLLGTSHGHTADLAPDAIHAHSQAVTVPGATTAGNYFILVQADALSAVAENNETNNVTAVPLTVSGTQDLQIENLTRSPNGVPSGGSVTVSYDVVNRGTSTVTATYRENIYLSTNPTFEPEDILLGTSHGHTADLAMDAIHAHSQNVTIPAGTAAGNYFIVVRADSSGAVSESDEGNNVAALSVTVSGPIAISNVRVTDEVLNRATVSWLTNGPATSQVEYGTTATYGNVSPLDETLTERHVITLTDLDPNTLYHFRVLSRDGNGTLVMSADQTFTTASAHVFTESNGQVVIEAEHYDTKISRNGQAWALQTSQSSYSGPGYLEAVPNSGTSIDTGFVSTSPEAVYNVEFATTGTFFVWVRGAAATANDDTVHIGIDGAGPTTSDRIGTFSTSFAWRRTTLDNSSARISVATTGLHTIHLWMREDGMKVDKILLRKSSSTTAPSGAGPSESDGRPRLMPLGDSITQGSGDSDFGYRDHLEFLLGVGEQEFVGSFRRPSSHPSYDVDHEGVSGERTDQVAARLPGALSVHLPKPNPTGTRILMHVGTNDMVQGIPIATAVGNVEAMVNAIHDYDDSVSIYVALIVPTSTPEDDAVFTDYNDELEARLTSLQGTIPNLFIVDMNAAFKQNSFWRTELMSDALHPNDGGYEVMAQTWAEKIAENE